MKEHSEGFMAGAFFHPLSSGGRAGQCCAVLSVVCLLSLSGSVTTWASDASTAQNKGLELSKQHCARCHIVSETDRFTGTSSSPSFKIMIEVLKDWEERFATFMARNPHPAHIRLEGDDPRPDHLPATIREVILTLDDIEAILNYVDSIASKLGKKPADD